MRRHSKVLPLSVLLPWPVVLVRMESHWTPLIPHHHIGWVKDHYHVGWVKGHHYVGWVKDHF